MSDTKLAQAVRKCYRKRSSAAPEPELLHRAGVCVSPRDGIELSVGQEEKTPAWPDRFTSSELLPHSVKSRLGFKTLRSELGRCYCPQTHSFESLLSSGVFGFFRLLADFCRSSLALRRHENPGRNG